MTKANNDYDAQDYAGQMRASDGLSLRDYFAAQAMHAFIDECLHTPSENTDAPELVARLSYEIADAMLLERAK